MSLSTYVSLGIISQCTARSISKKVSWICPKAKINVEQIVEDHWLKTKVRISYSQLEKHRFLDTPYHGHVLSCLSQHFHRPEILSRIMEAKAGEDDMVNNELDCTYILILLSEAD